ncbi:MAG: hypothetical protein RIG84_05550 [Roseovarius sp.]
MFDDDTTSGLPQAETSPSGAAPEPAGAVSEEMWLLGQPSLEDYLDYVRRAVVGGAEMSRRPLVDAWRAANDVYADLEEDEAGLADEIACHPLPAAMAPLVEALSATDSFQRTFDRVPTTFGMVELDKLIVSQKRVTKPFAERLAASLTPPPDAAGLFRFCQPIERTDPPVRVRRLSEDRFLFTSASNDLRFHEAALLHPGQLSGHAAFGPIQNILGLVVGYGSNFLSAIRSEDRMVLHNGYHRAVALRMAGITHAPCIIQEVTRRDELELTAASTVSSDPAFYFRAARPPLLKDFFDPRLCTVVPTRRGERHIELAFTVKDYTVYDA